MYDNVNKAVATRALGSLLLNMLRKVIAKLGLGSAKLSARLPLVMLRITKLSDMICNFLITPWSCARVKGRNEGDVRMGN